MKILLLTSFFPPTHTAGTEKRTLGYALSLQKLGHSVQVVCAGDFDRGNVYWNGYSDEIYQKIPVRRLHLNWMLAPDPNRYLYCNPVVEKKLVEWLKEWQPDIMHITSCVSLSASVIQAAKDSNIPVILTLTDFWFICPRVNLLRGNGSLCDGQTTPSDCLRCTLWNTKVFRSLNKLLPDKAATLALTQISRMPAVNRLPGLRGMAFDMEHRKDYLSRMIRLADYVTAPSTLLGETVNACLELDLVKVIHSGHDLSWLNNFRPRKQAGPARISYIGQIIPVKGLHILLSAFISANLADRAELVIYGDPEKDPSYFRQLEEIMAGHEVPITFAGPFTHENLGAVLSEVDVLIVTSLWHENNPRVIQEAFAAKLPVIASRVGGISEFIQHGVNGLLFERGDAVDLAKQLHRVVFEPDLLETLRAGIPPVKSVDEEILEFEEIYQELVTDLTSLSV